MNTFSKVALSIVGTITAGVGLISAPVVADSLNPNIVYPEMGGNWDCSARTYRPAFGSKISGELSYFSRHSGEDVAVALVNEFGLGGGVLGTIYVANQFSDACGGYEEEAPTVVDPTPVAPVAPPVVAPVAQYETYTGVSISNGFEEEVTVTRFNNDSSFRVTWSNGREVTYTLINGAQVKVSFVSRGSETIEWGTWKSFASGDVMEVTTESGTVTIPMA